MSSKYKIRSDIQTWIPDHGLYNIIPKGTTIIVLLDDSLLLTTQNGKLSYVILEYSHNRNWKVGFLNSDFKFLDAYTASYKKVDIAKLPHEIVIDILRCTQPSV